MEIANLVVSHRTASIKEIERAWHGDYRSLIEKIISIPNIQECAVLLTCNRVEVYVAGFNTEETLKRFAGRMNVSERIIEIHRDDKCLEHLLRVASGLESMMVGEDQILGQVRDFYRMSKDCGGVGNILDIVLCKAINVGKKVRNSTDVSKGSVSIGSAAVELAEKKLGTLRDKRVVIVGAGEMSTLVAKAIAHKECEVFIANRTYKTGEELAREVSGKAIGFDQIEKYIVSSDVVITATSAPHYVIRKNMVQDIMKVRHDELLIIDIALPRDAEEAIKDIPNVTLYTIDELREISSENLRKRIEEAKKAEKIIEEELSHLKMMLKDLKASAAICSMYALAEDIKKQEVLELYNKLAANHGVDETILPVLDSFADSLIKKYLRGPTVRLRSAARNGMPEIIESTEYLFGDKDEVSKPSNEKTKEGNSETTV
ncbi:MAG: glutamyl-tRNA reductase [Halobacteriota archaeon]